MCNHAGLLSPFKLCAACVGSSVGSIVAAIAAVHTDSELRTLYSNIEDFNLSFFANNSALDAMIHLMTKGSLQGVLHALIWSLPFRSWSARMCWSM